MDELPKTGSGKLLRRKLRDEGRAEFEQMRVTSKLLMVRISTIVGLNVPSIAILFVHFVSIQQITLFLYQEK